MKYGLVSCAKGKVETNTPVEAQWLYDSPLFKKASEYAKSTYDRWCILSAEHGLLQPDKGILPYDLTLNNMDTTQRKAWAVRVFSQIARTIPKGSDIYIHAGENYFKYLIPQLEQYGYRVHLPLKGLGIGKQLQWYKKREENQA